MRRYTTQGEELPTIERHITQQRIERYARAAGDFNPIHLDQEFAATTQFGGTIAHGMMVIAFVSEMLTRAYGDDWPATGKLKLRLRAPSRPGDTLTAHGTVKTVAQESGQNVIRCGVGVKNQNGDVVISGDASVVTGL